MRERNHGCQNCQSWYPDVAAEKSIGECLMGKVKDGEPVSTFTSMWAKAGGAAGVNTAFDFCCSMWVKRTVWYGE